MMRCGRGKADRPDQFRRTHRNHQQQDELELQMMIVLMAITLVFTVCWAPLQASYSSSSYSAHNNSIRVIKAVTMITLVFIDPDSTQSVLRAQDTR